MKATVTSKGQITVPLLIRKRLNLQAGTILEFDERTHYPVARRALDIKRMRSAIGCASQTLKGKSTAQWLEEIRGPVELPKSRPSASIPSAFMALKK
jgi:AbrB family looped-hinge helix DNA binding protein